jgi:signal transduction histidine kinase
VEDRGKGVAPGEETRIFEPFYRRSSDDGSHTGVGLGLTLVRKIAEAHGGRVYAANRRDAAGARFTLELAR